MAYYQVPISSIPILLTEPIKRKQQAQELIDKYLKPKVEVEKVTVKIEPKAWLPVIAGVCGFFLLLKVIK